MASKGLRTGQVTSKTLETVFFFVFFYFDVVFIFKIIPIKSISRRKFVQVNKIWFAFWLSAGNSTVLVSLTGFRFLKATANSYMIVNTNLGLQNVQPRSFPFKRIKDESRVEKRTLHICQGLKFERQVRSFQKYFRQNFFVVLSLKNNFFLYNNYN